MTLHADTEQGHADFEPPQFAFAAIALPVEADLLQRLASGQKLTGIVAPPGYGKTVLMSKLFEAVRAQGQHALWVPLDDRDTTPESVLVKIEAALNSMSPLGPLASNPFRGTSADLVESVRRSLNQLGAPLHLFVDNVNTCDAPEYGDWLSPLVFRTRPEIRLILSSTHALPVDHSRARLEGLLHEVGHGQLEFGPGPLRQFLGDPLVKRLGENGVATILNQTEGWPAAVRLMQIVLAGSDHPAQVLHQFSGTDRDISQLLNRRVLSGFDSPLRTFALALSKLRTFSIELCRSALAEPDAERYLNDLLNRNLFVISLDRNHQWFRLHGLFREFLAQEASRSMPAAEHVAILHRAALWCFRQSRWHDAIEYGLAADDGKLVAQIIDQAAADLVRNRGESPLYIQWVNALLAQGQAISLNTRYWYVWALVFRRSYEEARREYEKLEAQLEGELANTRKRAKTGGDLPTRVDVIRICLEVVSDRPGDVMKSTEHWIARWPDKDPFSLATATTGACIQLAGAFQFVRARQIVRQAQTAIHESRSPYGTAWVHIAATLIPIYEGNYGEALREVEAALGKAADTLGDESAIGGTLHLLAAHCAVAMGLDTKGREHLQRGSRSWHLHGLVDTTACGLAAAISLWTPESHTIVLQELKEIAEAYPPRLSMMFSCVLIQRYLELGMDSEAVAEAAKIGLHADAPEEAQPLPELAWVARGRDTFAAAQVHLCLALKRYRQAERLIQHETTLAKTEGRFARQVELALAEMVIASQTRAQSTAKRHLVRAVILAANRTILRPFKPWLHIIAPLVNETRPSAWGFVTANEQAFFSSLCALLPTSVSGDEEPPAPELGDPYTPREIELLRLIDKGLSNQHIADRLDISVATVKWHLYNLYAKLGVTRRAAAIARARAIQLLA